MNEQNTLLVWLKRLQSTYWFVPSIMTIAAMLMAVGLIQVGRHSDTAVLGWAYGGGAAGARELLSAVAGSMITVVSVTFSVTIVALTVSSQHFGPRLLTNFMRDTGAQIVLGTFIGTFAYCVLVLRTIRGEADGVDVFVPDLAVTGGVVLALVSVAGLIYYVHHVAVSLQVSQITQAITRDLERAIDRLYPQRLGHPIRPVAVPAEPAGHGLTVHADDSGYVQAVDTNELLEAATRADAVVWIHARPGDFVSEGHRLASAHPAPADRDRFTAKVRAAFKFGSERTSEQDAGFAVQQLVEVALRALSPGINEPFTATSCLDRLGQGLSRLAGRDIPSPARADRDGRLRVVAQPQTFEELAVAAFEPIRFHADKSPEVALRLLAVLAAVARSARREEDRGAVRRLADSARDSALAHHGHRTMEIRQAHQQVMRELQPDQPSSSA